MKRRLAFIFSVLIIISLAGCAKAPSVTNDGTPWSEDWIRVGATLGVEPPGNGLTLLDNKDALSSAGLYYAAWVIGESEAFTNAEGETVDLYDAQLYLLLRECKTEEKAAENAAEWLAMEEETYQVEEKTAVTCAGQSFTVLVYTVDNRDNPYSHGVSAFVVYGNHAISAELSCRERFDGDALTILTEFLNGLHYA